MIVPDKLAELEHKLIQDNFKKNGDGSFRGDCPFRPGSNSNGFIVWLNGPKIGWYDHVKDQKGKLSDLAKHYNIADFESNGVVSSPKQQTEYIYRNEQGKPIYKVVRKYNKDGEKYFPQHHLCPQKNKWVSNMGGKTCKCSKVKPLPYHLPKLAASNPDEPILIVEGEKDVHTAERLGFVATCNSGGAGKWHLMDNRYFENKHIVIIADNDEPGIKHADDVARRLQPYARTIKIHQFDGPKGYDLSDWVMDGNSRDDLDRVIDDTPLETNEPMQSHKFDDVSPYDVIELDKLLDGPLEIDWLVENLIPPNTTTILAGESGIGKTWLLLDLILSIASGEKWLGRFEVNSGPVLIIDEENSDLLLRIRLNQLIKAREFKNVSDVSELPIFFVVGQMAHLSPEKDKQGNIVPSEPFKRIYRTIQECNPVLTTFDSLTRVHRHNEMYAGDMALVFSQVKMLMDELKTACLFTHHFTKSGNSGDGNRIRGSGDIRAFADCTVLAEQGKDWITITHDKSRWSAPIAPFGVKIQANNDDSVSIVYDTDGSIETTSYRDVWTWLKGYLAHHGATSRKQLITVATDANMCKQRTLDDTFKWRIERGYLEKEKRGRETFYFLPDSEIDKDNEDFIDDMAEFHQLSLAN